MVFSGQERLYSTHTVGCFCEGTRTAVRKADVALPIWAWGLVEKTDKQNGEESWYWVSSLGLQSGEVIQAVGNIDTPSLFPLTIRSRSSSSCTSISVAMETSNGTETWYKSLHAVLKALNATLHNHLLCRPGPGPGPGPDNQTDEHRASLPGRNDNSYMYILFVMFLFAVTVGSLILGYTRSRKVDKRSDPYHVYIKNRVSMI